MLDTEQLISPRSNSDSSLLGTSSLPSFREEKKDSPLSEHEQITLRTITRSLRKAKRQLLLRSVVEPENNVDRMRAIIMKITVSDDSSSSNDSILMPSE
jgi:hypothetical protein